VHLGQRGPEGVQVIITNHKQENVMTVIIETPPAITEPVFTGRSRWGAAALVTMGAALQVAEFVLESTGADVAGRLAWWQEHPDRVQASQVVGLLAIPFLIGGIAVMVAMSRRTSRRLSMVAAVALTSAMTGLAAIHGLEQGARMAADAGQDAAATGLLEASHFGAPGIVLIVMFLVGAVVGTVTLYVSLWRSPLVPRLTVVFGAAFVVLDIGMGRGVLGHLAALASGVVLAWAIVTGYVRGTDSQDRARAH
jgi:hypothetical protein